MKKFIEKIIRFRNPAFQFDPQLDEKTFVLFIWMQLRSIIRSWRLFGYLRNPKGALLGKGVSFFAIHKMTWGKFMKLGDHVYLSALGTQGISFGNHVGIGAFSRVVVSTSLNHIGSCIQLGNNVGIGEYAYLGGAGGLQIGDNCIIGQYFSCHPENHIYANSDKPIRLQGVTRKGIKIGNNCWIGSKVTILDGVEIGNRCVIAAGAVVTHSFPDNSVIGGVPARLLKSYS
jgi:acetyltransferase-like isoleucine patch superfamily enzyme